MSSELFYLLALSHAPGLGVKSAKALIAYSGSAKAVFEISQRQLLETPNINRRRLESLHHPDNFHFAERELEFMEKHRIQAHSYLASSYPHRLKSCEDGPLILFQKGGLQLNQKRIIAVVGTRNATAKGLMECEGLLAEMKKLQCTVVSGLAYGIDICAHREALKNELPTAAVLAHGLDRIYPHLHRKTAVEMLESGGALLTEYPSQTNPDAPNFPSRNRIVAGMCDAIIVVEAAKKGGALITAEIANNYNRDVFALPGRISDPLSEGCNNLIKQNKAALLSSARDLEYILGWDSIAEAETWPRDLFDSLTQEESELLDLLQKQSDKALSLFHLSSSVSQSLPELMGNLMQLELKNLIRQLPGKMFTLMR